MSDDREMKKGTECQEETANRVRRQRFRVALLVSALMSALSVSAFASEGSGSGSLTAVMGQMDEVTTLVGQVFTMLTSNTYFATFLAIGLLSAGIGLFRRVKRAARR